MITKIPILTFHSVDTSGSVISIKPDLFKKLLKSLKAKDYQIISLSDVMQWLIGEKVLYSPSVVITFDDGYENLYYHSFPILEELGFSATIFLTTGFCGVKNHWPNQHSSIPEMKMLEWRQIHEMSNSVFEFEAHTQTHPNLSQLDRNQAEKELIGCQQEIEDRLGKKVNYFAYPFIEPKRWVIELVGNYFEGACTTCFNLATRTSERLQLPRIETYYFSGNFTSSLFLSSLFGPYLQIRRSLRLIRKLSQNTCKTKLKI